MFAPEPKPPLAANRPEAAPPSDQVKQAEAAKIEPVPLSPQAIAARNAHENQQALLRLLAVGVMILMALFLFVLWVLRKIGGLALEPVRSKSSPSQPRQSQRHSPKT